MSIFVTPTKKNNGYEELYESRHYGNRATDYNQLRSFRCLLTAFPPGRKPTYRYDKREVVDLLGNPEFKRSYNGIEQWEYKKLHFISGAVTTILLDFQHDKVISFNSYAGDTPSPAYPPIAICPPAPVEEIPSQAYPTDDQKWFQELYQKVKDKPFKDERLKILREAASLSDFTCDEIVQLMKIFNFDDERLEALAILEPTIIDRENTDRIVDSMTFISGEEKAKIY